MRKYNNIKLTNKNNFNSGGFDKNGKAEFERALFLLSFDFDPEAQKEGLLLLRKASTLGWRDATKEINRIKKENIYQNARRLYAFAYGKDIF